MFYGDGDYLNYPSSPFALSEYDSELYVTLQGGTLYVVLVVTRDVNDTVWSPIILNGTGFGLVANHSLVMGSHVSRANAAIADLRRLLEDG